MPDLFNEYWNYTKTIVGKVPNARPRMENTKEEFFWDSSEEQINILVENIKSRIGRQHINFDPNLLDQIKSFNRELSLYLPHIEELLLRKEEPFFTEYVNHIIRFQNIRNSAIHIIICIYSPQTWVSLILRWLY